MIDKLSEPARHFSMSTPLSTERLLFQDAAKVLELNSYNQFLRLRNQFDFARVIEREE
jgi:hypothetical protein